MANELREAVDDERTDSDEDEDDEIEEDVEEEVEEEVDDADELLSVGWCECGIVYSVLTLLFFFFVLCVLCIEEVWTRC
jgi:hypothetical protein